MRIRMGIIAAAVFAAGTVTGASPAHGAAHVLYTASWKGGISSWIAGGGSWNVKNGVLQYGGGAVTDLIAPYRAPGSRYAIEAVIKLDGYKETGLSESYGWGILVRASGPVDPTQTAAGLMVGVGRGFVGCDGVSSQTAVATADTDLTSVKKHNAIFSPGKAWHVYRVEVRGNTIKLLIDGKLKTNVTTTKFAGGTSVGLFSLGGHIEVKTFKVLGL